jgi:hypothetical protein
VTREIINSSSSFGRNYDAEVIEEIPGAGPIRYFSEVRCERPLLVRFTLPTGPSWVGGFGAGSLAERACSGVFASPSPTQAYVVSNGRAYVVDVEHPDRTAVVLFELVMQVVPDVPARVLLFADPWQLYAYAVDGLKWSSGRIAIEGLTVLAVDAQTAVVGMEDADGEWVERKVDVRTGALREV